MQKIKQYILDNYELETIQNIVNHGCVSGVANTLIYYHDTVAFHDEHEAEIWDMLYQDAQDQGYTVVELIGHFNGQKNVGSMDQFKNMLVWYAIEAAALDIIERGTV